MAFKGWILGGGNITQRILGEGKGTQRVDPGSKKQHSKGGSYRRRK